jgi:hypothetical protein
LLRAVNKLRIVDGSERVSLKILFSKFPDASVKLLAMSY